MKHGFNTEQKKVLLAFHPRPGPPGVNRKQHSF
jgi:hypothetical protein